MPAPGTRRSGERPERDRGPVSWTVHNLLLLDWDRYGTIRRYPAGHERGAGQRTGYLRVSGHPVRVRRRMAGTRCPAWPRRGSTGPCQTRPQHHSGTSRLTERCQQHRPGPGTTRLGTRCQGTSGPPWNSGSRSTSCGKPATGTSSSPDAAGAGMGSWPDGTAAAHGLARQAWLVTVAHNGITGRYRPDLNIRLQGGVVTRRHVSRDVGRVRSPACTCLGGMLCAGSGPSDHPGLYRMRRDEAGPDLPGAMCRVPDRAGQRRGL